MLALRACDVPRRLPKVQAAPNACSYQNRNLYKKRDKKAPECTLLAPKCTFGLFCVAICVHIAILMYLPVYAAYFGRLGEAGADAGVRSIIAKVVTL